jgi:WD40 repeat protein
MVEWKAMRLRAVLRFVAVGIAALFAGAFAAAEERPKAEIVPQLGHSNGVHSVAIAPDGKTALSGSGGLAGSWDNTLRLWDLASGREIRKFVGHTSDVYSVAFAPDGKTALSGSADNTLSLWDLASGREIERFEGHSGGVFSVAIAPDGKTALSGSQDKTLRLWDLASGREVRKFEGHSNSVVSVAIAPDGKTALSGSYDGTLRLWDLASGREIRKFEGHSHGVYSVAIAPDGKTALSGSSDNTLRLWDLASGREIRKFEGHSGWVRSVAFAPDGKTALSGSGDGTPRLWDLASGREIKKFKGHSDRVYSVAIAPEGKTALSGSWDGTLRLWDLASGREIKKFKGYSDRVYSVAIAPDGKTALSGGSDHTLRRWDLASGRQIKKFVGHSSEVSSVAIAPDGKTALSGGDLTLRLWDLANGREIKKFEGHSGGVFSVAIAPDGKTALSGSADNTLRLWDLARGHEIKKFKGHSDRDRVLSVAIAPDGKTALLGSDDNTLGLWDLASGREIRKFEGHSGWVRSVAFAPDGKTALSSSSDNTLRLWDLASGREIRKFEGHSDQVFSVFIAPDGKTALSGSLDGTVRLWDLHSGEALASLSASREGEQLAITPKGFFSSSQRDTDMLAIVRGLEVTTIRQVHQSLYNPDLVREALAGDPKGEVRRAAEVINLERVLDSGPAPEAEITLHPSDGKSDTDLVTVAARITDRGKGIGRIEWRVNGLTVGVASAPAGAGPVFGVRRELALDPGENAIEVVAYNARNLLASLPAQTSIVYTGTGNALKPKLHILAIGINAYEDRGWKRPGTDVEEYFPRLGLAVADAQSFAAEMKRASEGFYSEVRVRTALDRQATQAGLDRIVEEMSVEIGPRDTFVFFAAAHGYTHNGRYYLIPQDYRGGPDPDALAARAIGQDHLQDWIANRIKAKKAIILLDTCESGALTNGYAHSRVDGPASEAGIGRLHEATGRPVLSAAAAGHEALELTKLGHGVFTSAVIDALHNGDSNGNGLIEVSELVAHVQAMVPKLTASGEARAAVSRGAAGGAQSAHFGTTGGDFALVRRLP